MPVQEGCQVHLAWRFLVALSLASQSVESVDLPGLHPLIHSSDHHQRPLLQIQIQPEFLSLNKSGCMNGS